jgi:hypothetical protein
MFLFTNNDTPGQAIAVPPRQAPVSQALKNAANESGVSFDYLLRTANRESSLNPQAQASTSSASGLFQFVEQTWLGLVKKEGHRFGLEGAAAHIVDAGQGRYAVADPQMRQAILDLRKDPDLSSRMAAIFTTNNRQQLARAIGREPNAGELYIAHFLGASGGSGLIRLAAQSPDVTAANYFPEAASANRSIFFDGSGRARTAGEVYSSLVAKHGGAASYQGMPLVDAYAPLGEDSVSDSNATWSGFRAKGQPGRGLFDLYSNSNAPVSESVKRVWTRRSIDEDQPGDFALRPTLSTDQDRAAGEPVSLAPPKAEQRPAAKPGKPKPLDDEVSSAGPRASIEEVGEPLNLLKFMRLKG